MSRSEDLGHLVDEIATLRNGRVELLGALRAGVCEMRAGFCKAHAHMAKKTRAELKAFVSDLRETVNGLRAGFQADNAAAHLAWFGTTRATAGGGTRAAGRKKKAGAHG